MTKHLRVNQLMALTWACLLSVTNLVEASEETPSTIHSEISILCWDNELELTYPGHQGEGPILAPMQVRSSTFSYEGPNQILFSRPLPGRAEKGPPSAPVALATVPPEYSQALIILLPQRGTGSTYPYRAIVVDDRFDTFPLQSLRFLNFTNYKLAGQFGADTFEIAPKGQTVSQPSETIGSKHIVPFRMLRYIDNEDSWRPVRSTAFSLPPKMRILVLILEDPQDMDLRFVMLRDLSPPKSEQTNQTSAGAS